MNPIIFFRNELQEIEIARKYFTVTDSRVGIKDSLVIGRYSVLSYDELENDLKIQGSHLINSFHQYQYIARFDYYEDLKDIVVGHDAKGPIYLTPKTYFNFQDIPKDGGPFVVKGRTNSRKYKWNGQMFVKTANEAINLALDLEQDDPLIRQQGAIIREFVPLKTFEYGINGQPFANEWRFFFYKENILAVGYYWIGASEIPKLETLPKEAYECAKRAAAILSQKTNFFVLDIAETASGPWIVVEANDGQLSGLTGCDPKELYKNLSSFVK